MVVPARDSWPDHAQLAGVGKENEIRRRLAAPERRAQIVRREGRSPMSDLTDVGPDQPGLTSGFAGVAHDEVGEHPVRLPASSPFSRSTRGTQSRHSPCVVGTRRLSASNALWHHEQTMTGVPLGQPESRSGSPLTSGEPRPIQQRSANTSVERRASAPTPASR